MLNKNDFNIFIIINIINFRNKQATDFKTLWQKK